MLIGAIGALSTLLLLTRLRYASALAASIKPWAATLSVLGLALQRGALSRRRGGFAAGPFHQIAAGGRLSTGA